jgi:transcription elongation factor Elf1
MENFVINAEYAALVAARQKQNIKRGRTFNFRCPICLDSRTSKTKRRGYLFPYKGTYIFKCHRCGKSMSIRNFLRDFAPDLYDEYVLKSFKENTKKANPTLEPTIASKSHEYAELKFNSLPTIAELDSNHPAITYLDNRLVPVCYHNTFKWLEDQKRIIIPFHDYSGKVLIGVQGRTIDPNEKKRFLTSVFVKDTPMFFGTNSIDRTSTIYVTEGPFDSTFIDNSVSMSGLSKFSAASKLGDKVVFVLDNQNRHKEVVATMNKMINKGFGIVVWPDCITQKDVNDMILSGISIQDINIIVSKNTFHGMKARIKLLEWQKVSK